MVMADQVVTREDALVSLGWLDAVTCRAAALALPGFDDLAGVLQQAAQIAFLAAVDAHAPIPDLVPDRTLSGCVRSALVEGVGLVGASAGLVPAGSAPTGVAGHRVVLARYPVPGQARTPHRLVRPVGHPDRYGHPPDQEPGPEPGRVGPAGPDSGGPT